LENYYEKESLTYIYLFLSLAKMLFALYYIGYYCSLKNYLTFERITFTMK